MKTRKLHLSLLMFFQLCVVGAYSPIFSLYLMDYLNFTGTQIGVILSTSAIPSIAAPFIGALIVDRIITSRKFLAVCQAGAAVIMFLLSNETGYISFMITYLIYMILLVPTFALVNALVFHNSDDSNNFGSIRVWGTIGWIVASVMITLLWKKAEVNPSMIPYALKLSALFSVIVVILTLKLPKLKLEKKEKVSIIPKETFNVIIKPEVMIILIAVFFSSCADKFYFFGTPLFLQDIGVVKTYIPTVMSLGQVAEILMLFGLGAILRKLGFKNIFILALFMQVLRFVLFYISGPLGLTLLGVSLNGFIYALFYAASTIYLDNFTDEKSRGGVHQLFSMITVGASSLFGYLLAGWASDNFRIGELINFKIFWTFPTILSILTLLIITLFMKRVKKGLD